MALEQKPHNDKLLKMLIFDLYIAKLPPGATTSLPTDPASALDITALATTTNDLLKLMLANMDNIAPVTQIATIKEDMVNID
uniref:Ice-structuring protein n=1 Tax=Romanomermis culicivorax TaxID=13658 RepID=A0A915KDI8_ROMCU